MIQLLVKDHRLHTPQSAIVDKLQAKFASDDPILMVRYDAGDCDTIKWPRPNRQNLARALYDAREMGIIPDGSLVLLPDGTEFNIDKEVQ